MLTLWLVTGFLAKSEAVAPVFDVADTHDGYVDTRKFDRDTAKYAEERLRVERGRREAIESAWAKIFDDGPKAEPIKPSARKKDKVVAVAMRYLDTSGIEASARELRRLIDEYAAELEAERLLQKRNNDILTILLMSS